MSDVESEAMRYSLLVTLSTNLLIVVQMAEVLMEVIYYSLHRFDLSI